MSGDRFTKENFPVDLGKSFLGDWEADKAALAQMNSGQKIAVEGGADVSFEVSIQQQQQAKAASEGPQTSAGDDGFNWYPSDDLG